VERAASLTTRLLTFSRKEGREARTVDVNESLDGMERMLGRVIGEDVEVITRLTAEHAFVAVDPGDLEQVVMNLVLNARDAMPAGGRIVIETRTAKPPADAGSSADWLSLVVRDTGVGMDDETRSHIFEPFYTTKPVGRGTGLGLSTVYGIVQQARGHIEVESEVGVGTSIEIWLPTVPVPGSVAQVRSDGARAHGGEEKVLVVEDEDLVRLFVRRALEEAGYEVLAASNGEEALEIFAAESGAVDLVLTDVVMPRMKGPELSRRLMGLSPGTPVVYMSGYIESQALQDQLADRPGSLLRKPFRATELYEKVRRALDESLSKRSTD
jgi:CheY-like chemotaxis protein